jgi:hypothetical protein
MTANEQITFTPDEETTIIVEFPEKRGFRESSLSPEELAKKSMEAIKTAMQSIYRMSRQTVAMLKTIPSTERPSQAEVEFGIKFDAEAGAVLAKAGVEANINIKLVWEKEKEDDE